MSTDELEKLTRLLRKEVLTVKELQGVSVSELISSITVCKADPKRPKLLRFMVTLENGEIYFVCMKK